MTETIVLIEHDAGHAKAASLHAITFARQIGDEFALLILGNALDGIAQSLTAFGARHVLVVDDMALAHPVADKYAAVIADIVKSHGARTILAASSTFAKDVLPRVAALLDAGMLTDVVDAEEQNGHLIFRRPMYAGNAFGQFRLDGDQRVLSVRGAAFEAPERVQSVSPIERVPIETESLPAGIEFVSREERPSEYPDLTEARVVVSGGRPLKDRETFDRLVGRLASLLDGAVGATRTVVDAGIVPNDWQIGQTGKVVAPDLYIAIGISGAIQHLAGIKDAKVIVAINKDPDAPIFQIATYRLVGDLYRIVPELIKAIEALQ